MKVLMRSTKEWADTHGVPFCNYKSKVLMIGRQFSGDSEQAERPGVSKTKWPIGTEEKNSKYLGVTIGKRLEWKAHVDDIVSLSKPKHRQVQPLAANPYIDPGVVKRAWEQKVPPCLLSVEGPGRTQRAERSLVAYPRHSGGGGRPAGARRRGTVWCGRTWRRCWGPALWSGAGAVVS
jgi:hypothetical protein